MSLMRGIKTGQIYVPRISTAAANTKHIYNYLNIEPKFNSKAFMKTEKINVHFNKIVECRYFQGMLKGNLQDKTREIYLSQDVDYLKAYIQALKKLKLLSGQFDQNNHVTRSIDHLISKINSEIKAPKPEKQISGTREYIAFISENSNTNEPAKILAALYPCVWIYLKLANYLNKNGIENNKLQWVRKWALYYSSDEMIKDVEIMENLLNNFCEKNSSIIPAVQELIEHSLIHEYNFFESVVDESQK